MPSNDAYHGTAASLRTHSPQHRSSRGLPRGESPPLRTTVVIGDADQNALHRTRQTLHLGGFDVRAVAPDSRGLVAAVRHHRPKLCLLDVELPGGGCRSIAEVRASTPGVVVVVLTSSTAERDVLGAVRAGAAGYLLKDTDPERLPLALQGVLGGEAAIPRSLMSTIVQAYRGAEGRDPVLAPALAELTARQRQVFELLRYGMSTAEIAACLFVSTGTVRTHIAAIVHKLRVPDREGALQVLERQVRTPAA